MSIKGLYKTSLIDFPGRIGPVFFTGGCNLRCKFCHNPDLALDSNDLEVIPLDEAVAFMEKRSKLIDGITITGGEPTLFKELPTLLSEAKKLNLDVKLDSNGFFPEKIKELIDLNLVDYFAIDIKTSPKKYPELTQRDVQFSTLLSTINLLKDSNIDFEVRTTCIPEYVEMEDFKEIVNEIKFVKKYYLQQFVNSVSLIDHEWEKVEPYPIEKLIEFKEFLSDYTSICEIRGI